MLHNDSIAIFVFYSWFPTLNVGGEIINSISNLTMRVPIKQVAKKIGISEPEKKPNPSSDLPSIN